MTPSSSVVYTWGQETGTCKIFGWSKPDVGGRTDYSPERRQFPITEVNLRLGWGVGVLKSREGSNVIESCSGQRGRKDPENKKGRRLLTQDHRR